MSRVGGSGGAAMGGIPAAGDLLGERAKALDAARRLDPALHEVHRDGLVEGLELANVRRLEPTPSDEGRGAGPLLHRVDDDLRDGDAPLAQPGEERLGLGLAHRLGLGHEVERGPLRVLHQGPEPIELRHQLVQRRVARRGEVLLLPRGLLAPGQGNRAAEDVRGVEEAQGGAGPGHVHHGAVHLPRLELGHEIQQAQEGLQPRNHTRHQLPDILVRQEQTLQGAGGERRADGLGPGLHRLDLELVGRQAALPLARDQLGGLPGQAPLPDVGEGLGGLAAAENDRLLGSGIGQGESEGRGQGALACASLSSEQVQNGSVTHGVNVGCP
jgi:hypothetical protein